jgi:hypothetical protein
MPPGSATRSRIRSPFGALRRRHYRSYSEACRCSKLSPRSWAEPRSEQAEPQSEQRHLQLEMASRHLSRSSHPLPRRIKGKYWSQTGRSVREEDAALSLPDRLRQSVSQCAGEFLMALGGGILPESSDNPRQVFASDTFTRGAGPVISRTHKRCANCKGWLPFGG